MIAMITTEELEQRAVIEWCEWNASRFPQLRLLFHIPNGGSRSKSEGAKFKGMGVKPGVPDLFLPVPRPPYHGLFIEMKSAHGRVLEPQKGWLIALSNAGYKAVVCYGARQAINEIENYMRF